MASRPLENATETKKPDIGTIDFSLAIDPGTCLALVGGIAGSDTSLGTFGLEISNVPVPAGGLLLGSVLMSSGLAMRLRRRADTRPRKKTGGMLF